MSAPYRVEAQVGSYLLASQDGDPAGYGLADPCQLSCSLPNADLAPLVQRDPDEATLSVIAPDAATYSFNLGDQVRLTIYPSHVAGSSYYAFFGRIAQLRAQPHALGILYTMDCVDYTADLAELKAGRVDYPQESSLTRLNRMLAENGIPPLLVEGVTGGGGATDPTVSARVAADEGQVSLTEAVEEILSGWTQNLVNNELGVAAVNTIGSRYELRPNIVNPGGIPGQGQLDTVAPFKITPIYRPQGWAPPARLDASPLRKLTVAVADSSPSTEALILDAGHVDFAPTFVQQKANGTTRVVLQCDGVGFVVADWSSWGSYQWAPAAAALEATVKTRLVSVNVGTPVASMYRGSIQPGVGLAWTVGELSWRASRTQAAGWVGPKLRRVCTVARVDAVRPSSHIPTNKAWVVGVVDGLRVVVQGGEVVVNFTVAPMHYTRTGPSVVPHQASFAAATLGSTTYAQLDPRDTWADYLLLYA